MRATDATLEVIADGEEQGCPFELAQQGILRKVSMLLDTLHELVSQKSSAQRLFEFNRRILEEMIEWTEKGRLIEYFGLEPQQQQKPPEKSQG
ncbi:MAG: hypothetical protein KDJ97_27190 [Anaerolineae bacterium]|nr:hypothetical protein [Anaerolineae bacterium]